MGNLIDLLGMISWVEFIFYVPIGLFIFFGIFNTEITYACRVYEHYHYSLFVAFWYALFIPDKHLKCDRYNLNTVRKLEFALSSRMKPDIIRRATHVQMGFGGKNGTGSNSTTIYFSESGTSVVDGDTVLLTPHLLIEALCLHHEYCNENTRKKNMLT